MFFRELFKYFFLLLLPLLYPSCTYALKTKWYVYKGYKKLSFSSCEPFGARG